MRAAVRMVRHRCNRGFLGQVGELVAWVLRAGLKQGILLVPAAAETLWLCP